MEARLDEINSKFDLNTAKSKALIDTQRRGSAPRSLRGRLNLIQGALRAKRRQRLKTNVLDPATARFWCSLRYPDFLAELGASFDKICFDRDAWSSLFDKALCTDDPDLLKLDAQEVDICSSGSAFGRRLNELRQEHEDWPFIVGNLSISDWLRVLSDDEDPQAADVYFAISRGFTVLPPELAADFKASATKNYGSALENMEAVDAEIFRLKMAGFIGDFHEVLSEMDLDPDTVPNILAIGAVLKKGKVRIVIDGSMPRGSSINDAIDPADTLLPSITMAIAAMTRYGAMWKSDFTDAFLQHVLHPSSVRLCCVEWRGKLYAYRRLGFGFRSGPTFQQSVTICIVRALTRRLRRGGLHTAEPPSVAHKYPHIEAKTSGKHFVNAVLAFLDDVGGFCSAQGPAWFSFCQYLLLCKELSIAVSFKPGKTEPPSSRMIYLGIVCDCQQGIVYLDEDRVRDLQERIANVKISETLTVVELQSLTGILVFCSVVIRLGRLHYHALIDAVTKLGPHPRPSAPVKIKPAIVSNLEMWQQLLQALNFRSARALIDTPRVPGECATDASLTGYGWCGMGVFIFDKWPEDWDGRLGRELPSDPPEVAGMRRIYICECELWCVLFIVRALAPRCPNHILRIRVDNEPVCMMINKFSTRSAACLPILQELCWLCAIYAVELEVVWIDTKSNVFPDLLSRRFSPGFDQAEWDELMAKHAPSDLEKKEWRTEWPVTAPVRPELVNLMPVARLEDFSTAWASMSPEDLADIMPLYLPKA